MSTATMTTHEAERELTRQLAIAQAVLDNAGDREKLTKDEERIFDAAHRKVRELRQQIENERPLPRRVPDEGERSMHYDSEDYEPATRSATLDKPDGRGVVVGTDPKTGHEVRAYRPGETIPVTGAKDPNAIGRFVRSLVTGAGRDEFRDMGIDPLSSGGHLVPTPLASSVIELARNQSRVLQAGALVVPMESSTLKIARQLTDPVPGWRAEHQVIPESGLTFDAVELDAKTLGVIVRLSRELFDDSAMIGDVVRRAIAGAIATAFDYAALFGEGTDEPLGVTGTDNIQTIENVGVLTDYDPFSRAVEMIANVNGNVEDAAVIMAPRDFYHLERVRELLIEGQPLRPPASWERMRKLTTNQIVPAEGATSAFVGGWRNVLIGSRMTLELKVSEEASTAAGGSAFQKFQVLIRGVVRADVAVARAAELVHLSGILTEAES